MSHFSVLVVGDDHEHQLAPFHEFECTGYDDEFVQTLDITEEKQKDWQEDTITRLKAPDGTMHRSYDDQFYREFTPEELVEHGAIRPMGSGFGNGLSWTSKDWGDGRGYRAKVQFVPEGFEEVEVPLHSLFTFEQYLSEYCEIPRKGEEGAKYHWFEQAGETIRVFNRTNPNRKWDWWQVGGRYSDKLLLRDGTRTNSAQRGEIAWGTMQMEAELQGAQDWDQAHTILSPHPAPKTWEAIREAHADIQEAREAYHAQPAIAAFAEANRKAGYTLRDCDEFICSRGDYIKQRSDGAFSVFAFVKDRQWQERGQMGWFACVSNEKDKTSWHQTVREFIASLPDDAILTVVDCHI